MGKKIILMLTVVFLLYEVLYYNSNNDSTKILAYSNDLVYGINASEEVLNEIKGKYSNDIIIDDNSVYIMCDVATIKDIEANYNVDITK